MNSFIQEYGRTIVAVIIVLAFVVFASVFGDTVTSGIKNISDDFFAKSGATAEVDDNKCVGKYWGTVGKNFGEVSIYENGEVKVKCSDGSTESYPAGSFTPEQLASSNLVEKIEPVKKDGIYCYKPYLGTSAELGYDFVWMFDTNGESYLWIVQDGVCIGGPVNYVAWGVTYGMLRIGNDRAQIENYAHDASYEISNNGNRLIYSNGFVPFESDVYLWPY